MNKEIILYVILAITLTVLSYSMYWIFLITEKHYMDNLAKRTTHEAVKSECIIHEKR